MMKNFTMSEMLHSAVAISHRLWNGANREQELNLLALVGQVLDPARDAYGDRVVVNSAFRTEALNRLVGGASQSQHMNGEAADVTTDEGPRGNLKLASIIVAQGRFDQLILENVDDNDLQPQWLHVSWRRHGINRHEVRKKVKGTTKSYPLLTHQELALLKGGMSC
jgi:hypothetical protein